MMSTMSNDQNPMSTVIVEMNNLVAIASAAPTAEQRAIASLDAYNYARGTLAPALAAQRRAAVRELRAIGYSLNDCARLLGVTDSRIAQITGT